MEGGFRHTAGTLLLLPRGQGLQTYQRRTVGLPPCNEQDVVIVVSEAFRDLPVRQFVHKSRRHYHSHSLYVISLTTVLSQYVGKAHDPCSLGIISSHLV